MQTTPLQLNVNVFGDSIITLNSFRGQYGQIFVDEIDWWIFRVLDILTL